MKNILIFIFLLILVFSCKEKIILQDKKIFKKESSKSKKDSTVNKSKQEFIELTNYLNQLNIKCDINTKLFLFKMPKFSNQQDSFEITIYGTILSKNLGKKHYVPLNMDSIFIKSDTIQKIILDKSVFVYYLYKYKKFDFFSSRIKIIDINQDGFIDIGIEESSPRNKICFYYIYNKYSKEFKYSNIFRLPDLVFNKKDNTYSAYSSWGGNRYEKILYKLINGKLVPFHLEKNDYDDTLNSEIKEEYDIINYKIDTIN